MQEARDSMDFPVLARRAHVQFGKAQIHGTVTANGHIAVDYIETTDPAFNDPAWVGIGALVCAMPAGTPIEWGLDFADYDTDEKQLALLQLRRGGRDPAADQRRVLVLLPQGIDPTNDHDGLNDLSRRLTSALGARLAENLQKRGIDVIGVLDQRPIGIQEKLEAYASSVMARHLLVVTVETVPVNDEEELRYRVQYSDQDLIFKSGRLEAVIPSATSAKTYKIKGSKSGAAHVSVEALADDFVKGLDDDGRLKGLVLKK
jgi:hypothetical protein